jgi:hypothetical protein
MDTDIDTGYTPGHRHEQGHGHGQGHKYEQDNYNVHMGEYLYSNELQLSRIQSDKEHGRTTYTKI